MVGLGHGLHPGHHEWGLHPGTTGWVAWVFSTPCKSNATAPPVIQLILIHGTAQTTYVSSRSCAQGSQDITEGAETAAASWRAGA